jgi:GSCFA family
MTSPYENLDPSKFWRTGVGEAHPLTAIGLYKRKFALTPNDRIATGGSCFAQHISNYLRANGFSVMDKESPPPILDDTAKKAFGYGLYSARYGNIYTVRQLLQLAEDAFSGEIDPGDFWTKNGRVYDALRPNVEPRGFESLEEAIANRKFHLAKVRELLEEMTVFIFTFGLTEAWVNKDTGRVYPTAPGTIAGDFDPEIHAFKNFTAREIHRDFTRFHELVRDRNAGVKFILTVSPVPLTATASDRHVLLATTYSKSVLRAVAGELADSHGNIDYFPSYEIIASPWSKGFFYESNLRSVNPGGVAAVMRVFFEQHGTGMSIANEPSDARSTRREERGRRRAKKSKAARSDEEVVCEEILLDAFAQ